MWLEIVLLVLTFVILYQVLKKPSNYPPGPWGLPLIGYISKEPLEQAVLNLNKKYGKIVCTRLGTKTFVLLYDYKIIKEAFSAPNIAERPESRIFSLISERKKLGISSTNGEHWHNIRRFALRHLKDLGMGKSWMVEAVQREAEELVIDFKRRAGKPILLPNSITVVALNVIWRMVADKRYKLDDKEILEFNYLMNKIQTIFLNFIYPEFFPWIHYIIPNYFLRKFISEDQYDELSDKLKAFFRKAINEHADKLNENSSRDFIDAYLIEMKRLQKENIPTTMSLEDLMFCISDLFGAAIETTTTLLNWCIYYLAKFPDVQTKLQRELDEVLPDRTQPNLEDKQELPYTEAFIQEINRHVSVASIAIHMAREDTQLRGYHIPKDAYVIGVALSCHYNSEYFESPEEFRPERFLNSNGKLFAPKEGFLPFGIGRRQCIGEALARMKIFIFLTTLVQNFTFSTPPGKEIDITPADVPLFHVPKLSQEIVVTIR